MDVPDLVSADAVGAFPGAPFDAAVVSAAAQSVRGRCGWHIAPEIIQELTLDHDGSRSLLLPSLHVTAVASVEDVRGPDPVVLTGWSWSRTGILRGSFPAGLGALRVTLTHGYAKCPTELLPAIADEASGGRVRQESLGSAAFTYEPRIYDPVDAYRIAPSP